MGLLSGILTLPLAPVRGVVWVAEQMKNQAEREYYDPRVIQRQLAEVDEAHANGELTDQQRDELQEGLLARLFEVQRRRGAGEM
ncbi:gas vesicle protein GvpG [Saccharopolyspora erythraea]|uniref:gas vesicle protein GvpG n=1 Tax=Saccharopolyspora erythraea TaxID=1836 RepID=UPI001BA8CA94|nr:gas vesicle protein GvpG [Saccharopolyspora erythraea]QUH00232.1 gas vesicle protein GvpG [Saccharopolyspora erythraea]